MYCAPVSVDSHPAQSAFLDSTCWLIMEEKLHHHLSECGNESAGHHMRFEVLMAMNNEIKIIRDTIPCGLVYRYQNFKGTCCLHFQDGWRQKCCSKMLVPNVLSKGKDWPSYVVFVLHNPMPNSDEVEIISHCPDFVYCKTVTHQQDCLQTTVLFWNLRYRHAHRCP